MDSQLYSVDLWSLSHYHSVLIVVTVEISLKLSVWALCSYYLVAKSSLVAQLVKSLPAVQETQIWFLGPEDPLEKEMATCSSILAWRIPWTEEPGGLQSVESQELDKTYQLNHYHRSLSHVRHFVTPWTVEC